MSFCVAITSRLTGCPCCVGSQRFGCVPAMGDLHDPADGGDTDDAQLSLGWEDSAAEIDWFLISQSQRPPRCAAAPQPPLVAQPDGDGDFDGHFRWSVDLRAAHEARFGEGATLRPNQTRVRLRTCKRGRLCRAVCTRTRGGALSARSTSHACGWLTLRRLQVRHKRILAQLALRPSRFERCAAGHQCLPEWPRLLGHCPDRQRQDAHGDHGLGAVPLRDCARDTADGTRPQHGRIADSRRHRRARAEPHHAVVRTGRYIQRPFARPARYARPARDAREGVALSHALRSAMHCCRLRCVA